MLMNNTQTQVLTNKHSVRCSKHFTAIIDRALQNPRAGLHSLVQKIEKSNWRLECFHLSHWVQVKATLSSFQTKLRQTRSLTNAFIFARLPNENVPKQSRAPEARARKFHHFGEVLREICSKNCHLWFIILRF